MCTGCDNLGVTEENQRNAGLRSSGPIQFYKPFLFFSCQKNPLVHFFPTCVNPNTEKSTTGADLVGITQAEPRAKAQVIFLSLVPRHFCRSP